VNLDGLTHNPVLNSILRVAPFIILIAVVALRVRQGRIQPADIGWQRPRSLSAAFGWWLLFLGLAFGWELLLWSYNELELGGFKHAGFQAAVRIVGMILLAPVAEELIFRGLFFNFLTRKLNNVHLAVVLQAVVFVALHNFAYQATFSGNVGVAQSFIDACLFAYARRQTGSIFVPIAMHVTGNSIAVIEMLWS
jgi:membrane protease YdiL (CAAX protease family)